jgi:hypothetical protein
MLHGIFFLLTGKAKRGIGLQTMSRPPIRSPNYVLQGEPA